MTKLRRMAVALAATGLLVQTPSYAKPPPKNKPLTELKVGGPKDTKLPNKTNLRRDLEEAQRLERSTKEMSLKEVLDFGFELGEKLKKDGVDMFNPEWKLSKRDEVKFFNPEWERIIDENAKKVPARYLPDFQNAFLNGFYSYIIPFYVIDNLQPRLLELNIPKLQPNN